MEQRYGNQNGNQVPDNVAKRFNWGAFFLTLIWGIFNNSPIAVVLCVIVIILAFMALFTGNIFFFILSALLGMVFAIICGMNGNKWAYQNKNWQSVESFHNVQKNWAAAGLCVCVILPLLQLIFSIGFLSSASKDINDAEIQVAKKKAVVTLSRAIAMNRVYEVPKMTAGNSAGWFVQQMNVKQKEGNKVTLVDGMVFEFVDNGICATKGECYIKVDVNGDKKPNKDGKDIMSVPFYLDTDGNPIIKTEDTEELTK